MARWMGDEDTAQRSHESPIVQLSRLLRRLHDILLFDDVRSITFHRWLFIPTLFARTDCDIRQAFYVRCWWWTIISRKMRSTRTNKSSSALSAGSRPGWPREASRLHRERHVDEDHRSAQTCKFNRTVGGVHKTILSSCRPARIVSDATTVVATTCCASDNNGE